MKHWFPAFVLGFALPLGVQAAIGITTPTVNSGELIRASDWNKVKLDLETLAAATEALQNQSWSSSGSDTYYSTGKVGIGLTSPTAELSIFLDTPNANDPLLQLGTTDDADRFTVDEDGDVTLDGKLVVRDSDIYESGGDLELSGEDNLYLSIDWNDDDTDTNALLFGKNSAGAGGSFAELMRIDEGGNVGIGTPTPNSLLQVAGSVQVGADAGACAPAKAGAMRYSGVAIERCDGASWDALATTSVSDNLGNHTATEDLDLATFKLVGNGGTDGIVITSAGKVGIGGALAPAFELEVANVAGDDNVDVSLSTDASGANAYANFVTESPVAKTTLLAHGTGRSLSNYGQNVSGWGELRYRDLSGSDSGGLMVGTQQAVPMIFGTNDIERMRVNGAGNVGIGEDNPTALLDIQKASPAANETVFRIGTSTDSDRFEIDEDGDVFADGNYYVGGGNVVSSAGSVTLGGEDNLYLATDWNNDDAESRSILFGKNGYGGGGGWAELMRIDENGEVGININNPANKLHVVEDDSGDRVAVFENEATTGSPEGLLVLTGQSAGAGAAFGVGTGNPSVHTKNFVVTNAGTVGVNDPSPDGTLRLDVNGQVGASEYCDQNGSNCRAITSMGGKFVDGDTATDAVFTGGFVGIGVTNPTFELHIENEIGDNNVNAYVSTNAAASDAYANFVTESPATRTAILSHGLGRSVSRFGQNLSGWGEVLYRDLNGTENGLIVGTLEAVPLLFGTQNAERMRISADGHVGIGSTNPNNPLTVHAVNSPESIAEFRGYDTSNNLTFLLENSSGTPATTGIKVRENVTDVGVFRYNHANSEWRVFAGGSDIADLQMVIEASGNIGIGTPAPGVALHIEKTDPVVLLQDSGASGDAAQSYVRFVDSAGTLIGQIGDVHTSSSDLYLFGRENLRLATGTSTEASTKLIIDSTGNVGIGTADPAEKLEVAGMTRITSATPRLRLHETDATANQNFQLTMASGKLRIEANNDAFNSASPVMTLEQGGDVGIGTTDPTYDLHVVGNDSTNAVARIDNQNTGSNVNVLNLMGGPNNNPGTNVDYLTFSDGDGTTLGAIEGDGAGNVRFNRNAAGTYSDRRLKNSIQAYEDNALDFLNQFETVTYKYNEGTNTDLTRIGFVAQDVLSLFPQAVNFGDDLSSYEAEDLPELHVNYGELTPVLVKAVQELKIENEALKARLEALEQSN